MASQHTTAEKPVERNAGRECSDQQGSTSQTPAQHRKMWKIADENRDHIRNMKLNLNKLHALCLYDTTINGENRLVRGRICHRKNKNRKKV